MHLVYNSDTFYVVQFPPMEAVHALTEQSSTDAPNPNQSSAATQQLMEKFQAAQWIPSSHDGSRKSASHLSKSNSNANDTNSNGKKPNEISRAIGVGSFEIVDKLIGKGVYLDGVLSDNFTKSIAELMEKQPTQDDIEALLEGFCAIGARKLARN